MIGYHTRGINIVWGTWQYQGVLDEDSTKHQRELITSLWSAKTRIMIRGRRVLCTALGWVPVNRNSSLKSSTGSAIVLERMQEELAEVSGARNSSRPSIRIRYHDHHFLLFGKSVRRVLPPPPSVRSVRSCKWWKWWTTPKVKVNISTMFYWNGKM